MRILLTFIILLFAVSISTQAQENPPVIAGYINDAHVVREYPLVIFPGDIVTLKMTRLSGDLVPFIGINLGLDTIARSSETEGRVATLRFEAVEAGEYKIVISRYGVTEGTTSGDFMLTLVWGEVLPSPEDPIVELQVPSASLKGEITDTNFRHDYYIHLDTDQTLSVTMAAGSGDLSPTLLLINPAQGETPLVRGTRRDDGSLDFEFTAPESGLYMMIATRFDIEMGTTQGTYQLRWTVRDAS